MLLPLCQGFAVFPRTMDFRSCTHASGSEIIKTLDETNLTGEAKRVLDR